MEPTKYKSEMYEAMIELMNQDKIEFTATYDHKGYLTIFDVDKDKYEKTKKDLIAKYKKQKMTEEEIDDYYTNNGGENCTYYEESYSED